MSDDSTRVMTPDTGMDRTMISQGGMLNATQQMPMAGFGDAMRTQIGGTTTCPICKATTPLMETYCGDCGYLMASTPVENLEVPVDETPVAELIELGGGRRYRLRQGVNTIGRQGTDIVVSEGTVSRVHAQVTIGGGAILVEDLGSTNGTKVGDVRIEPNQPTPANNGMPLKFGNWIVTLEVPEGIMGSSSGTEATVALSGSVEVSPEVQTGSASTSRGEEIPSSNEAEVQNPDPESGLVSARLIKTEGAGEDLLLSPGTMTLGRKTGNTFVIQDAFLSGQHAQFHTGKAGTFLTDIGSTNGTVVNGKKLIPNERLLLLEGDTIQLGQTRYTFLSGKFEPHFEETSTPSAEADVVEERVESGEDE